MNQLKLFDIEEKTNLKFTVKESTNYEEWINKFESSKTTDDCFTPQCVYDEVLNYVVERFNLSDDTEIVRPFYPGGDFENSDYPQGCVVVDNPPFSILSKILKFYVNKNIRFFLFCNHLTAFSAENTLPNLLTYYIADARVKYANGAIVKTSFITNLDDISSVIVLAGVLKRRIEKSQKNECSNKIKVIPHPNVMNSARIGKFIRRGVDFEISKNDVAVCRWDKLFGGGFVISSRLSDELFSIHREITEEIPEEIPEEIKNVIKMLDSSFEH